MRIVAEELKNSDRLRPTDVELYDVVLEGQKESPAVSHGLLAEEVVPSPGAPFETPPRLSVASPEGRPAERQLRKPEESLGVPNDLLISTAGNGVLRTSEVISKGISKTTLAKFVEKYNYERISHGIYCSPDVWKDGLSYYSFVARKQSFLTIQPCFCLI